MGGGGGGGIPIVSDVVNTVSDVLASVDPGPAIGDVGASVDQAVNDTIPGGWATVGAVAATIATAGAAAETIPEAIAAETGAGAGDVFAGLSASAPVDTTLSQAAANSLATGTGAGITGNAVLDSALTGAGKGALLGGGKALLTGQDPLTGALTGAATGAVGGGLGNMGTQLTDSNVVGGALGGLGGGATSAAIGGRDPVTGALIGGLTGGTTAGINSLTDSSLGSVLSPLTGSAIANLIAGNSTMPNLTGTGQSLISGLPTTDTTASTDTGALPSVDTPIVDLKPGLVKGSEFKFASTPSFTTQPVATPATQQQQQSFPLDYALIQNAATGGLIHGYAEGESVQTPSPFLKAQTIHGQPFRSLSRFAPVQFGGYRPREFAEGGAIPEGHDPTFFSEGGLNSLENTYVKGPGDGTSDSVPAMLANGEFVIPADVVSRLGNGSNDAGADALSQMLVSIRKHAQQHDPKKLPPKSKNPLAYLLDAKRKVG